MRIVLVHNDDTGIQEIANDDKEVRIDDKVVEQPRNLNHNRKDGWRTLIREISDSQSGGLKNRDRLTIESREIYLVATKISLGTAN